MKPVWKWVIGVVAFLIIVVVSASWYLSIHWKPIVEDQLKEAIKDASDSLYTLKYDDLDINPGLGNVVVKNVELIPDSNVYKQMDERKEAPNNRVHIKVSKLKIVSFNLIDILKKKKLKIESIEFESPKIHLMNEYHAYNDTVSTKPQKTLYESVKKFLNTIQIGGIKVEDISFKYTQLDKGRSSHMEIEKVNLRVRDVLIDSTSISDSLRFYHTKMIELEVPKFEYPLPNGLYKVGFEKLKINTEEQNILLTKVSYLPQLKKDAFYKKKGSGGSIASLRFDTVRFENLDFKNLMRNKQLTARRAQIRNGSVVISSDKRYHSPSENKIGQSPHQKLLQLKGLLRLDTVLVENVDVTYSEFSNKYLKEGSISFDHTRGYLTNVTNDSVALKKDKWMRANLSSNIMGSGLLKVEFGFDMLSKQGEHTYKGSVGAMNATAFNRILRPLLNVEIASGNIKRINFDYKANDYRNWGTFKFDYNHLKINILNEQGKGEEKVSKRAISFLVNSFILNDSNPDANEIYHVGNVNYKRVPQYPFFKTLWQSLLAGIKQCVGMTPEREAKLMGKAETATETISKTKKFFNSIFKKKDKKEEDKKEKK
ncbi:hypothetical protein [Sphingobacterium spiritivorum]|uniref:hypothetical protein n=1 Tax=Sphingobacterium spiritivorum TaxID=258 RepID=UPI001918953F|nr:hypothetical protein [Sphingobacterium spiritivorum]QQT27486.1 hypothetical protein I6J02_06445 [Sphingobacterium spiritivorum]